MKNCLIAFYYSLVLISIDTSAQQREFKFDFGSNRNKPGYICINANSEYDEEKGFGFSYAADKLEEVDRGGDPLKGDFITSAKPFYFSVRLPEGNYDVKLILGDTKGYSATTVRTENRRLMLENIRTIKGQVLVQSFTVHIRDSLIRNEKGEAVSKVRLKPREFAYLHWDNRLTIEFNDSLPKVCALEITPNKTATTIFLTGNSTVVDQDKEPWAAWGQIFPRFLVPVKVVVANYAESGETLKAFKGERRLEKIWSMAKPGDFLFIEFAHNDQKAGANYLDPFTTYKQTTKEWIAEARRRGLTPVLVTSMHRRNFDSTGHIVNTLLDYPEAMRQAGKEENVAVIDLNAMSKILYESWGPLQSLKAFVHYPANTFPGQTTKLEDNTHFSPYGAYELARCIVGSIKKQHLPLARFVRKEIQLYDPATPTKYEKFYWPLSLYTTTVKPDGN